MRKYLLFPAITIILFFSFATSLRVFAQAQVVNNNPKAPAAVTCPEGSYCLLEPLPGIGSSVDPNTGFGDYANKLIRLIIGAAGALAVVMIVIGGIQYMSTDAVGEKSSGKETMQNALIGLGLALVSYLLLYTINPQLTVIKDNLVPEVSVEVKDIPEIVFETGNIFKVSTGSVTPWDGKLNVDSLGNVTTYDAIFKQAANKYSVECTRLKAHAYVESSMKPTGNSGKARGLMQVTADTANGLGYPNYADMDIPEKNIDAGAKYIAGLKLYACPKNAPKTCTTAKYEYIAAAYNGGPGNNSSATDCPKSENKTKWQCEINRGGLQETYDYTRKIEATYQKLVANKWGCN